MYKTWSEHNELCMAALHACEVARVVISEVDPLGCGYTSLQLSPGRKVCVKDFDACLICKWECPVNQSSTFACRVAKVAISEGGCRGRIALAFVYFEAALRHKNNIFTPHTPTPPKTRIVISTVTQEQCRNATMKRPWTSNTRTAQGPWTPKAHSQQSA